MTITVKYLAALADTLNKSEDIYELQATETVAEVWQALNPNLPLPANTLCAIDFTYAKSTDAVKDNAELAFFPPVTGG